MLRSLALESNRATLKDMAKLGFFDGDLSDAYTRIIDDGKGVGKYNVHLLALSAALQPLAMLTTLVGATDKPTGALAPGWIRNALDELICTVRALTTAR